MNALPCNLHTVWEIQRLTLKGKRWTQMLSQATSDMSSVGLSLIPAGVHHRTAAQCGVVLKCSLLLGGAQSWDSRGAAGQDGGALAELCVEGAPGWESRGAAGQDGGALTEHICLH